ncbi:MAG: thiosulfate oxidation carrier complex protein SoxZ [Rhodomicrobium sp.]
MAVSKPRVRLPAEARAGQIIEIKTLIAHEMENGQRRDASGNVVPRKIINKFIARFNGKEFLSVDWYPAISANPYQAFYFRVRGSGTFEFVWKDDDGSEYKSTHELTVT